MWRFPPIAAIITVAMPLVTLVLPSTSYKGADFVAAADELGVDLVVATDGAPGIVSGRLRRVVPIDCSAPAAAAEAIVADARLAPVDAVVGVDDSGALIAAMAAERLGLPHNAPESVTAASDKAIMRGRMAASGVAQPAFRIVESEEDAHRAAGEIGFPVVVKPVSLSASRGVIRADDAVALAAALDRIDAILDEAGVGGPLLVEEYMDGDEVAVEALATSEGLEVLAVFDKPDPLHGPYFEETIYVTPSRHPVEVLDGVERVVRDAVAALGLAYGPAHAEVRLTPEGPRLIEVAARSIGGLCGRSLRFGMLGQSLESLLLRAALGMPRRGMRRHTQSSGVMMLPITADGILRGVRRTEAVAEVEGITGLEITVPVGRRLRPLPEGDRYLGFLFAAAEGPHEVESALREAYGLLEIVIEPSP
jgi:biotin carboxylase